MQTLQKKKHQNSEVLDFKSFISQVLVPIRHGPDKDQTAFSQSFQIPGMDRLELGRDSMQAHGSSFMLTVESQQTPAAWLCDRCSHGPFVLLSQWKYQNTQSC